MNLSSFSMKVLTASMLVLACTSVSYARGKACYKGERMAAPAATSCCCYQPACPCLKDGFYLGAQVGYDNYTLRNTNNSTILGLNLNPRIAANGWVGGLFLGYGKYISDMGYLGGEIFTNYSNAEAGHNFTSAYNNQLDVRGSYGLSILPGIRINNTTLGYIRLGYNWVRLKTSESINTTAIAAAFGIPSVVLSTNKTRTANGFNYGLGMETLICDMWSVRTEYNHTNYSSFTSASGTKISSGDNQYLIGIVYHFA